MMTPCAAHVPTPARAPRLLAPAAAVAILAGAAAAAPTPPALQAPVAPATSPAHVGRSGPVASGALCAHGTLERAMRLAASQAADPGAALLTMRVRLAASPACFPGDLTVEELAAILAEYQALPPALVFEGGLRYISTGTVWTGDVTSGTSGRALRANLTYSFVPDTASWDGQANTLNATLTQNFGAGNEDRGKEFIRQALANWRRHGGLTYQEVADNGTLRSGTMTRSPGRGDIRIGGNPRGTPNYLAYNYFPSSGGDMLINTSYFNPGSYMGGSGSDYRYLRNVIAHEHGHGTGFNHVVPCENNKLMEPYLSTAFDMLTVDERRGAGRNYGDRLSGNSAATTAHNLGELASPAPRSVIERDLSTNGSAGFSGSGADWFRFTLATPQPVTITAAPTGGSYNNGGQTSGCEGAFSLISAQQAGNLNIELRTESGGAVLQSAASAAPGQVEVLGAGTLPAGVYTVRVYDAGPNANQTVQLYDLTLRVGAGSGATANPQAIAGVNKRVAANTNCYFMGNINSRPLEPGAALTTYTWDLDGDGVFEIPNHPQPFRRYPSNGVYPVTLRVTDSNGRTAADTITVTVFGGVTAIDDITPDGGIVNQNIPVTITGTNLKNVTSASMVAVSGAGVTVSGTPVPNTLGTQVTGLTFNIAAGAAPGPRDVTVTNADGTGTGVGLFTVSAGGPACPPDWNNDGAVNSNDISAFLTTWLGSLQGATLAADFNNDLVVNSNDISSFLSAWLDAVTSGC